MANGQQIAEENLAAFMAWSTSKLDSGRTGGRYSHRTHSTCPEAGSSENDAVGMGAASDKTPSGDIVITVLCSALRHSCRMHQNALSSGKDSGLSSLHPYLRQHDGAM